MHRSWAGLKKKRREALWGKLDDEFKNIPDSEEVFVAFKWRYR